MKFNIRNPVAIAPPVPPNGGVFGLLSAKQQKKRRKNKMKALKKQAEAAKLGDSPKNTYSPPIKFTPAKFMPKPLLLPSPLFDVNDIPPAPQIKSQSTVKEETKIEPPHTPNKSPVNEAPATESPVPSANESQNDDYFAKINTPQSSLDMSEWPESLMYVYFIVLFLLDRDIAFTYVLFLISFRNYVNRCFQKCVTSKEKEQITKKLKTKIVQDTNSELLWLKDWDQEPLPM